MPAAAVIPAPIAYIIVVAVKKFVVGFDGGENNGSWWKAKNFSSISVSFNQKWLGLIRLAIVFVNSLLL